MNIDRRAPLTSASLGPAVVALLLPQRPPFLMVDRITGVALDPIPTLRASRFLTANEAVLAGHFPKVAVWPGALTIEAMGQAAAVLSALVAICAAFEEEGSDLDALLEELANIECGATLNAGHRPDREARFRERLEKRAGRVVPLGGSVKARFHRPVFPGCRLDLQVWLTRVMGELRHFTAEALVDGELVAEATLGTSRVSGPAPS